jgi:uncharacterized membrane protein
MKINYVSLAVGVLGAGKLIAQSIFGVEIPDEVINNIVNGISAVVSIVAIFHDHKVDGSK